MKKIEPRNNGGYIVLQVQVDGKRKAWAPVKGAKWGDRRATRIARGVGEQVALDIASGNFDATLEKYKPKAAKDADGPTGDKNDSGSAKAYESALVINSVDIRKLFVSFTEFKSKTLRTNSLVDYDRVQNKLNKCPHVLACDAREIMNWLVNDHKGSSTKSLEKQWKLINACCKWAVSNGELEFNPFDGLKALIPATKNSNRDGRKRYWTKDERDLIIKAFWNNRYYKHYAPLVDIMFSLGLRPSEAIGLQWKHLKGGKLTIEQVVNSKGIIEKGTKTEERRAITIGENSRSYQLLMKLKGEERNPEDLIFRAKKGGVIDLHNFTSRAWASVLEKLEGVDKLTPYHMRHTAITHMLRDGADVAMVAKWVGNSPNVIAKYYLGDVSDIEIPEV